MRNTSLGGNGKQRAGVGETLPIERAQDDAGVQFLGDVELLEPTQGRVLGHDSDSVVSAGTIGVLVHRDEQSDLRTVEFPRFRGPDSALVVVAEEKLRPIDHGGPARHKGMRFREMGYGDTHGIEIYRALMEALTRDPIIAEWHDGLGIAYEVLSDIPKLQRGRQVGTQTVRAVWRLSADAKILVLLTAYPLHDE